MTSQMFKQSFDHLATPTIIWERSLVVHYVNQAFFDLNGFPFKIPSDINDYALIHALSGTTLKNYYLVLAQDFFNVSVSFLGFFWGVDGGSSTTGCLFGLLLFVIFILYNVVDAHLPR